MKAAIVIGAGITGVASAEWLRRDGWQVTLVDRVAPGDPAQASFGNGGILARCAIVPVSVPGLLAKAPGMLLDPKSPMFLRWSYLPRLLPWLVPFLRNGNQARMEQIVQALAPLTGDAVDQHLTLAKGTPAERFVASGDYIYLYPDEAMRAGDAMGMALREAYGMPPEHLNRAELLDRDPALGASYQAGMVFRDHGWITDPGAYVATLAQTFRSRGGTIKLGEVAHVEPGPTPTITLTGGETLTADRVILAAGVWSRKIAERLGCKTPMESERGYHLLLHNPSVMPPVPYMIADAKFVATPMDAGLRLAGVVEFGGLDAPPADAPLDLLRHHITNVYPDLSWEVEQSWMGHRPSTNDSLPMLGTTARAPGVIFAFGSQHIGLTIGARLGRMVADVARDRKTNVDLAPYSPDRFT